MLLENVINRWAHRFGIETINELVVKDQDQINLELLDNVQYQKEIDLNSRDEKITNNEIVNKDIYESYKDFEAEELPLPNINDLRKWIKKEKKAS